MDSRYFGVLCAGVGTGLSTLVIPNQLHWIASVGNNFNHHKIWAILTGSIAGAYCAYKLARNNNPDYHNLPEYKLNIFKYGYIGLLAGISISACIQGANSKNLLYRKDCMWFNPYMTALSSYVMVFLN